MAPSAFISDGEFHKFSLLYFKPKAMLHLVTSKENFKMFSQYISQLVYFCCSLGTGRLGETNGGILGQRIT